MLAMVHTDKALVCTDCTSGQRACSTMEDHCNATDCIDNVLRQHTALFQHNIKQHFVTQQKLLAA